MLAASGGRPYTPVQIQKALFLVCETLPDVISEGPTFGFEPYDYGPFDAAVYQEAEALRNVGEAIVAPSGIGRWNTYAASDLGIERGQRILQTIPESRRNYIQSVSDWVRSQSFSGLVKSIYDAYPQMRENSIFRG